MLLIVVVQCRRGARVLYYCSLAVLLLASQSVWSEAVLADVAMWLVPVTMTVAAVNEDDINTACVSK